MTRDVFSVYRIEDLSLSFMVKMSKTSQSVVFNIKSCRKRSRQPYSHGHSLDGGRTYSRFDTGKELRDLSLDVRWGESDGEVGREWKLGHN